jgi:putative DNA primase/helicase
MSVTIDDVLAHLEKVRTVRKGEQWTARCPAHDDRNPSLSVGLGRDGKLLFTCHAHGCSFQAIMQALGLDSATAQRTGNQLSLSNATEVYDYHSAAGKVLYKVARYASPKDFRPWQPDGRGGWEMKLSKTTQRVAFRLPELNTAPRDKPVLWLEGEKDVDRAITAGFVATTTQGGAKGLGSSVDATREALAGRRVAIIPDADDPGDAYAADACAAIKDVAAAVIIIKLPGLEHKPDHGEDLSDWFDKHGHTADELTALIGGTMPEASETRKPPKSESSEERAEQASKIKPPLGVLLSDVQVEDFRWLWHGRAALGKITIADGDPGLGKSLFTTDLAARVSMGRAMPDGSPGLDGPAGVVLICGEDGLADTVKPRLLAAGASPEACARVRAIDTIPETLSDGTISQRLLSLLADLGALEVTIISMGARLLVIDPITAYLGNGVDMYRDSDLRRVLTPLAGLAERTSAAIILVRHLNKNTATPALHRGLGGVGFIGVARLGLLFAPNPDAEGEVLVSRHKGNIGQPPPTLAYRIVQVGEAENMPRISWLGERETSAGAALASQSGGGEDSETRSATDEAVAWLRAKLSDGPQPAKTVQAEASAYGISEKVLRTARLRTCKKPTKEGMAEGWKWELDPAKMSLPGGEGIFGDDDATDPELNGTLPKMPSSESSGHLRTTNPPKMPSEDESGHLRKDAEFNGLGGHSIGVSTPNMPSDGRTGIFVEGDTNEHPPADVAPRAGLVPALRRHCDYCETERNFDYFGGMWRCVACDWQVGTPVVRTTASGAGVEDGSEWGDVA